MSALSELLNSQPVSARQAADRARENGIRLPYGTIAAYWSGGHGKPSAATLEKLAQVLPTVSITQLQEAAWNSIAAELGEYTPPSDARFLDERQRHAVDELIRSIVATRGATDAEQPDTAPPAPPEDSAYPPRALKKTKSGRIPAPSNEAQRLSLLEFYGFTPALLEQYNLGDGKVLTGFLVTVHTDALEREQPDLWADTLISGFDEQLKNAGAASVRGIRYLAAPAWVRRALARTGWVSPTMFQSPRPTALAVAEAEQNLRYDPQAAAAFIVGDDSTSDDETTISRLTETVIADAISLTRAAVDNAKTVGGLDITLPTGDLLSEFERHARLVRALGPADVGQAPFNAAKIFLPAFKGWPALATRIDQIEREATGPKSWGDIRGTVATTISGQTRLIESAIQVMGAMRDAIEAGVDAFVASGETVKNWPQIPPEPVTINHGRRAPERVPTGVEVYQDGGGQYRWRVRAGNGEIAASGQVYASAERARDGAAAFAREMGRRLTTTRTRAEARDPASSTQEIAGDPWYDIAEDGSQDDYAAVARTIPGLTDAERRHAAQNRDAEAPDQPSGEDPA